MHIGALEGKGAKNNKLVLEVLALNGSLIKYGIFREMKKQTAVTYPTISRRVDDLKRRGYLRVTGLKKIRIGVAKGETKTLAYGLTYKSLIAVLTSEKVRSNFSKVSQTIPGTLWPILTKVLNEEEVNNLSQTLLEGINKIPFDLESVSESEISGIVISIMFSKMPESYLRRLQRRPEFLRYVYDGFLIREKKEQERIIKFISARRRLEKLMEKTGKGKSMKG